MKMVRLYRCTFPVLSILRTTQVSDSRWQLLSDCNNIGLTTLTVEIPTHSGCSLNPIFRLSNRHQESLTAIGREADISLQQAD